MAIVPLTDVDRARTVLSNLDRAHILTPSFADELIEQLAPYTKKYRAPIEEAREWQATMEKGD